MTNMILNCREPNLDVGFLGDFSHLLLSVFFKIKSWPASKVRTSSAVGHDYTGTTGTVTASYAAKPAGVAVV